MADYDCKLCKDYNTEVNCYHCENGSKFKKINNFEKIRNMSIEEIAKTLTDDIPCKECEYWSKEISSCNAPFSFLCTKGYAEALILNWLQSEAE